MFFARPPKGTTASTHTETGKDHGRIEIRETCCLEVSKEHKALLACADWPVASVVRVGSTRTTKEKTSTEARLFLSTLSAQSHPAAQQAAIIRGHWSVENHLHRALDVSFHEDDCTVRRVNTVKNLAVLRRLAQTMLLPDSRIKSVAGRMRKFNRDPHNRQTTMIYFAKARAPQQKLVIIARP